VRACAYGDTTASSTLQPCSAHLCRGSPPRRLLRSLRPPTETSLDLAACRTSRSGARCGVPLFRGETHGAVGGRLCLWQRGLLAESGSGGSTSRRLNRTADDATRSTIGSGNRLHGRRSSRRLRFHTEGSSTDFIVRGFSPLLIHRGICGSPAIDAFVFPGQFRPLGCCRPPLQSVATFAAPFFARPDPDVDDFFRSSVPPPLQGALLTILCRSLPARVRKRLAPANQSQLPRWLRAPSLYSNGSRIGVHRSRISASARNSAGNS
jgi:hypothetical protein